MIIREFLAEDVWLDTRKDYVGASEVGTLLGANPYDSGIKLWEKKMGLSETEVTPPMEWGNRMEEVIAKKYFENHPNDGFQDQENKRLVFRNSKYPSLRCTPDRIVLTDRNPFALVGLEIKNVGAKAALAEENGVLVWGDPGTDRIPRGYWLQCQTCLMLTEYPEWHLAALIGGQDYREYVIKPDPEFWPTISKEADEFMGWVKKGEMPPPVTSEEQKYYLAKKWLGKHQETFLTGEATLFHNLRVSIQNLGRAKKNLESAKNEIKELIGPMDGFEFDEDGKKYRVTWKEQAGRKTIAWEEIVRQLCEVGGIDQETLSQIKAAHTQAGQPFRVFRTPRSWGEEE